MPSLALGAYLAGSQEAPSVSVDGGWLRVDDRDIPIDREGRAVLRYRGAAGTHDAYNAAAVIQSEVQILSGQQPTVDPELLRDRYVFFGFTAPGLFDLRPTPVSGVEDQRFQPADRGVGRYKNRQTAKAATEERDRTSERERRSD